MGNTELPPFGGNPQGQRPKPNFLRQNVGYSIPLYQPSVPKKSGSAEWWSTQEPRPAVDPALLRVGQEYKQRIQAKESQRFADVMLNVTKNDPKFQASLRKLGVDLGGGIKPSMIRKNLPAFRRAWEHRKIDNLHLKDTNPLLYKNLTDLDYAEVAWDLTEDLSVWDGIWGDLQHDWYLNLRNKLVSKATVWGEKPTAEDWAEIEKLEDLMKGLATSDSYFTPALRLIGQQAETLASAIPETLIGGAAGTLVGPGPGTVAGMGWGLRYGYAESSYLVNSGGSYIEQIRRGVSHDVAVGYSRSVGAGSTVLEMLGARAVTGITPGKLKKAFAQMGKSRQKIGLGTFIKKAATLTAIGTVGETTTETAQTGLEIWGEHGAITTEQIRGRVHPETGEPLVSRYQEGRLGAELWETMVYTAQGMSLLSGAAGLARSARRYQVSKQEVKQTQKFYDALGDPVVKKLTERLAPDQVSAWIRERVRQLGMGNLEYFQMDVEAVRRVLGELGMNDKAIADLLPDAQRAFDLQAEHPDIAAQMTIEIGDFVNQVIPHLDIYKALAPIIRAEGDFVSLEQLEAEGEEINRQTEELNKASDKAEAELKAEAEAVPKDTTTDVSELGETETRKAREKEGKADLSAQIKGVIRRLNEMADAAGMSGKEKKEQVNVIKSMLFQQYSLSQVMDHTVEGTVRDMPFDQWFAESGFQILVERGSVTLPGQSTASNAAAIGDLLDPDVRQRVDAMLANNQAGVTVEDAVQGLPAEQQQLARDYVAERQAEAQRAEAAPETQPAPYDPPTIMTVDADEDVDWFEPEADPAEAAPEAETAPATPEPAPQPSKEAQAQPPGINDVTKGYVTKSLPSDKEGANTSPLFQSFLPPVDSEGNYVIPPLNLKKRERHQQLTGKSWRGGKTAAQSLEAGAITRDQWDRLIDIWKPVTPYTAVPTPATTQEMQGALNKEQSKRIGPSGPESMPVNQGDKVGARLDIPAYRDYGVWAVAVHKWQADRPVGKVAMFDGAVRMTNVVMGKGDKRGTKAWRGTSMGKAKNSYAVMNGTYVKATTEENKAAADAALNDPAWRQVGMDPERHGYFYDRKTGEPIVSADEVIQVGPLVLAKGAKTAPKSDFLYQDDGTVFFQDDADFANEGSTPPSSYVLSKDEKSKIRELKKKVPGIGRMLSMLQPDEVATLVAGRGLRAQALMDIVGQMPSAAEMAAVGKAGIAKLGWYRRSAKALQVVFGKDAPRFAALLAALSPQTSVESNLTNALKVWAAWTQAGRPTGQKTILKIMAANVEGSGTEKSVLEAWQNNSYRALMATDPTKIVLSGPKVDSFQRNLLGMWNEVTNDAWMANYAFLDQEIFSADSSLHLPGKGPGYLAMTVAARKAAKINGWDGSQVQETVWSWAKALYEKAEHLGRTALDVLTSGDLLHQDIDSVPDFAVLFNDPAYSGILANAGYVQQLAALANLPGAAAAPLTGSVYVGSDVELGHMRRAAKRLDQLAAHRRFLKTRAEVMVNLSASTPHIPGLKKLTEDAEKGDKQAALVLQEIVIESLQHLTAGIETAEIQYEKATGLYKGVLESAVGVRISFLERDRPKMLQALRQFAENFDQEQFHVRGDAKGRVGKVYSDGSFNTVQAVIDLKSPLSRDEAQKVIDASGLQGATITDDSFQVYFAGDPTDAQAIQDFKDGIQRAKKSLGDRAGGHTTGSARLWVYGEGVGAIGYGEIEGELRPPSKEDKAVAATQRIATRLAGREVQGTPQAERITESQASLQARLAEAYERMEVNNLDDPNVRRAYDELAEELMAQYDAMPIKVESFVNAYEVNPDLTQDDLQKAVDEVNQVVMDRIAKKMGPIEKRIAKKKAKKENVDQDVAKLESLKAEAPKILTGVTITEFGIEVVNDGSLTPNVFGRLLGDLKKAIGAPKETVEGSPKDGQMRLWVFNRKGEPYGGKSMSKDMRYDVLTNNRLFIYATVPGQFGPGGVTYDNHPMLQQSGRRDVSGRPLLMNDLLRAVHDYYAHTMTTVGFGPLGEEAAWRNHMEMTRSPWARWALTNETRGQNSWVNFREEVAGKKLRDRPFAEQKTDLVPLEFVVTGDPDLDASLSGLPGSEGLNFQQQDGPVFEQDDAQPDFYSALAQETAALPAKSMKASGWKQAIQSLVNKGKIKKDEVFWSGIEHWLDLQEGKITKEAVQEYLELGGVRIVPLTFMGDESDSESPSVRETGRTFNEDGTVDIDFEETTEGNFFVVNIDDDAGNVFVQGPGGQFITVDAPINNQFLGDAEEAIARWTKEQQQVEGSAGPTRHGQDNLVLPGGRNYREVLLMLPSEVVSFRTPHWDPANVVAHIRMNERTDADGNRVLFIEEIQSDWGQTGRMQGFAPPMKATLVKDRSTDGQDVSYWSVKADGVETRILKGDFQPDVARAVKAKTAEDAIDWVKSNRGDDETFGLNTTAVLVEGRLPSYWLVQDKESESHSARSGVRVRMGDPTEALLVRASTAEEAIGIVRLRETLKEETGEEVVLVPTAPFVTSTKGWLNLALKKILLMATNEGFDRVAFVDGQTSADRYDLSKHVDEIQVTQRWKPISDFTVPGELLARALNRDRPDGRVVTMVMKNGDPQTASVDNDGKILESTVPNAEGKMLDEVVGKEMAEKIMGVNEEATFEGEDLKVGGEGMIKFYDEMLPQAAKKMVKKLGGKTTQTDAADLAGDEHWDSEPDTMFTIEVTPEMREAVAKGLPLFSEDSRRRGKYQRKVTPQGMVQRVITLVLGAHNVSTLLHEAAHLFFDWRIDLLRESLATPGKYISPIVARDIETLFDIMEVGDPSDSLKARIAIWDAMPDDDIIVRHEAVARNFERYMMESEGDAPSSELVETFSRISTWMLTIYENSEAINTAYKAAETKRTGRPFTKDLFELTPEVREVFDRLFAAKQDVSSALMGAEGGIGAGYGDREDEEILNSSAAEVGRKLVADAVRQGLINPQRIESRIGKEARRVRRAIKAQELEKAQREQVNRMRRWLATGQLTNEEGDPIGDGQDEIHKLNTARVREIMAPEGTGLRELGSVTSPDGMDPRDAATMFGYTSAREMLADLRDKPRIKDVVRKRTQERMRVEFSELATPDAIHHTVVAAVAGAASQAAVVSQLNEVLGRKGDSGVTLQAARNVARRRIRRMQLVELRTDRFEQSARRNRRLAKQRWEAGDTDGAVDAYRAELVDTATVREIARQRVKVATGQQRLVKYFDIRKDRVRAKTRDTRYLAVGRQLLSMVGLGPKYDGDTQPTDVLSRRDPEFVVAMTAYLGPFKNMEGRAFKEMTTEEFDRLMHMGELLWDRAATQKFAELSGKKFDRDVAVQGLAAELAEVGILKEFQKGWDGGLFNEVGALLARSEHAMMRLSGGERGGWWRMIYKPIRDAVDRAHSRQRKHLLRLRELLNKVNELAATDPDEVAALGKGEGEFDHIFGHDAEAGQSVTHELIAVLVNLGTQSNRDRVMIGRGWSERMGKGANAPANLQPMLNFLRRMVSEGILGQAHFDLAQGILDTYEEILPSFQAATLATQGIYADELKATPLVVRAGDKEFRMAGGYAPARYADDAVTRDRATLGEAQQAQGLFFGNSATKDRVQGFSDKISLRLSDTMLAFQDHIRFAEVAPVAKQVRDLLEVGEVEDGQTLGQLLQKTNPHIWKGGADTTSVIHTLLSRATTGQLAAHVSVTEPGKLKQFLTRLRNSYGLIQFSLDLKNAKENFSGIVQAGAMIGPKWVAYGFFHMNGKFATEDNLFMENRLAEDTQQVIATDINSDDNTTQLEKKIAYVLPRWTQNIVDIVVWNGAFQKYLAEMRTADMTDSQATSAAREYANSTVRLINSADLIDVGGYEGKFGEFGRLLTQWFSWANGQQQLTKTLWVKTMHEGGVFKYPKFLYRFLMQHWCAYMVAGWIQQMSRDVPDDEEELIDAAFSAMLVDPLEFTAHTLVPIGGDILTGAVKTFLGERAYDAGRMPAVGKFQTAVRDVVGLDSSAPKAMAELLFLFRYMMPPPLRAAASLIGVSGRQIGYASQVIGGDVKPTGAVDAIRGSLTGKVSPDSRVR